MLDFLACHSAEKLVVDAEAIAMSLRLLQGIEARTETLATAMFAQVGLRSDFLKLKETRSLFRQEQYLPSPIIDRGSLRAWQEAGSHDTFARARARTQELLVAYKRPQLSTETERAMYDIIEREARRVGLERLPGV
jgi:trimethylamine:corrinoid methyltransferase-like protein